MMKFISNYLKAIAKHPISVIAPKLSKNQATFSPLNIISTFSIMGAITLSIINSATAQLSFRISGTLYKDNNGSKNFNSNEPILPANITINLINSTNNTVVATTTTTASGTYLFTGVMNGSYQVQVDTSDSDIPTGFILGTANNVPVAVNGSNQPNINFGFNAGSCLIGGAGGANGTGLTPYISNEIGPDGVTNRNQVDTLDDTWRNAANNAGFGKVTVWNSPGPDVPISSNAYPLLTTSSGVMVNVSLLDMPNISDCLGTVATGQPNLDISNALQGSAPRPASLYNTSAQPRFWNENSGAQNNRNAVLFEFSQPVAAFGAWFGDLETRTDGGTPAILRLFDDTGNRIGEDIIINPSIADQSLCGAATFTGCGNQTTRWIGFVDPNARVKKMLVIVGDDDLNGTGNTQHLSFIGATLAESAPTKPNLLLVKRITAINGNAITGFVDDPGTTNDNNPLWLNPVSTSLAGTINGGFVKPGDVLEYTIYFLSIGGSPATNVNLCDLVPVNSTFIPNSFNGLMPRDGGIAGADSGISLTLGSNTIYLTNVNDSPDRGQFFAAGTTPSVSCSGANTNGAIVVKVVTSPNNLPTATTPGNPATSYGFIRFRARVN